MTKQAWMAVSILVSVMSAACSGSTTGTDLTSGDGGAGSSGGGGGGLLGPGTSSGGATNNGSTSGGSTTSSSGSTTSSSGTTAAAGVCGTTDTSGVAACDTCLNKSCCTAYNNCGQNPECVALWECAKTCGDRSCGDACKAEHPDGNADLQAFLSCYAQTCTGACPK